MSAPANRVPSSGKDLCFGFKDFRHQNYNGLYGIYLRFREIVKRKVCHTRFIVVYFFTDCFYLWYQYPGPTKIFHDCEYLQLFTRFPYIFFIKSEAMFPDILW